MAFIVKDYWNDRYTGVPLREGNTSGYGSYGEQLSKKISWLKNLDINSIFDLGCGDFNFGFNLLKEYPKATYHGFDISSVIIEKNKKLFPQYSFSTDKNFFLSDLTLCIDVLLHVLDDDEYESILKILEAYPKYLAVTAYEYDHDNGNHVKMRKFDYKRFGEPIIREIIEEDGQMYFYLFKRPEMQFKNISACLNTKELVYPKEVLDSVTKFPFGEILIRTNSDSPSKKQELFAMASKPFIYYQDDDAIVDIQELLNKSVLDKINVGMKPEHFESYKDKRMTMGLGWGSIFLKKFLESINLYRNKYGEDEIYKREDTRIFTYLNYPQNRIIIPIEDLPSAYNEDRLSNEPNHYDNIKVVEEKCAPLLGVSNE